MIAKINITSVLNRQITVNRVMFHDGYAKVMLDDGAFFTTRSLALIKDFHRYASYLPLCCHLTRKNGCVRLVIDDVVQEDMTGGSLIELDSMIQRIYRYKNGGIK